MPQKSLLRRTLLAEPLPLAAALDTLARSADVPASMKPAIKSTAIDAVRHALRRGEELPTRGEALAADIRDLIPILHVAARRAAELKGHRDPGDHERRAHRLVVLLTGRRYDTPRLDYPCPDAWQPLVDAISANVRNANGEIGLVARCCKLLGQQNAPRQLPTFEALLAVSTEALRHKPAHAARERVKNALTIYRRARERLLDGAEPERRAELERRFAPMPRGWSPRTSHLGVEAETLALLRELGHEPATMTAHEMFRAVAPELAADYDYFVESLGERNSDSYLETCLATLLRVAGWMVRAGRIDQLRELQLDDLFAIGVEVDDAMQVNRRIARRRGVGAEQTVRRVVSLLEHLAEREAEPSLRRSTVTGGRDGAVARGAQGRGRPYFTLALWQNCSRIWEMTETVYGETAAEGGESAQRWALVASRWGALQKQLSARQLPAPLRITPKDKLRLIRTVTLPQLVCVGLPMRRRELHALREAWLAAREKARMAGHTDPDEHPAVRQAAQAYFDDNAVPHLMLALALDDGLRRQQYTHGRFGYTAHLRPTLTYDQDGHPTGVGRLTTTWSGARKDPAHLKIREKDGQIVRREGREVRAGIVDFAILWDVISWWRPRQLVAGGAYQSLLDYDLEADMAAGRFALFPSRSTQVTRPHRSRTDVSELAGQELHRVVRSYLRPELPAWGQLDNRWRALWAMHATRLLISSYWGGVRDDWKYAKFLTLDEEETLRRKYTTLDEGLQDYLTLERGNWEHLNAYDPWMDRLCRHREVFDPLLDPALPLPEHLRQRLEAERAAAAAPRPRIRKARPGQRVPARRSEAAHCSESPSLPASDGVAADGPGGHRPIGHISVQPSRVAERGDCPASGGRGGVAQRAGVAGAAGARGGARPALRLLTTQQGGAPKSRRRSAVAP